MTKLSPTLMGISWQISVRLCEQTVTATHGTHTWRTAPAALHSRRHVFSYLMLIFFFFFLGREPVTSAAITKKGAGVTNGVFQIDPYHTPQTTRASSAFRRSTGLISAVFHMQSSYTASLPTDAKSKCRSWKNLYTISINYYLKAQGFVTFFIPVGKNPF